jgi:protein involved in sex pheromone biosynthesis
MKRNTTTLVLLAMLSLTACGDNEEEANDKVETKDINRDGAIESIVTTENLGDTAVLLVTTHKIWRQNAIIKEIRKIDTLPSLNTATEKKDYEFYITVK